METLFKLVLTQPQLFHPTDLPCCLRALLPDPEPDFSQDPCSVVKEPPKPHSVKPQSREPHARMEPIAASPLSEFARTYPGLHRPKLRQI